MPSTFDETAADKLRTDDKSENPFPYDQQVPVFVRGAEGKGTTVQGQTLGRREFSFRCAKPLPVGDVCSVYLRSAKGEILPAVEATVVQTQEAGDQHTVQVRFACPIDLARYVDVAVCSPAG